MPDLSDLVGAVDATRLERDIVTPPFALVRQRHAARMRRRRRRTQLGVLAAVAVVAGGVTLGIGHPLSQSVHRPAATLAPASAAPHARALNRPGDNLSGLVWLKVVLDQKGDGFAVGEDCGAAETFCTLAVRHTSDGAKSWQPVPPPPGIGLNPGRQPPRVDAATVAGRLWFQVEFGGSGVQTGTAEGGWARLASRGGRFDQTDVVGAAVVLDDYAPAGRGQCGIGVTRLTGDRALRMAHQPRQSYGTEQTRVAADGSLWQVSPAYPASGCTLKRGTEVHGKVLSIAGTTGDTWSEELPVPDLTTPDFTAFTARQALGLLTFRNLVDINAPAALTLLTTDDSGRSWSRRVLPVTATFAREQSDGALHAFSPTALLVTTQGGVVHSADGGGSFQRVVTPSRADVVSGVSILSPSEGVIVTQRGSLWRSDDAGASWVQLPSL